MYSRFQLAKKYFSYYRHASSSAGHGIHSPFVFDFVTHVLNGRDTDERFASIEQYRAWLLKDKRKISVQDFGAGSAFEKSRFRTLSEIASSSLKNRKFSRLFYRIARYYDCKNIIELGTSFGTTAAYFSLASPDSHITTLEGADRIADIAEDFFESAGLKNITILRGNFDNTVPALLSKTEKTDLLFVDGNHREEPTVLYFESFLRKSDNDSIFIFDDIHWSKGMENAWRRIKDHPSVTLTIDLFFVGLVFFKREFLVKQDFKIRF